MQIKISEHNQIKHNTRLYGYLYKKNMSEATIAINGDGEEQKQW